VIIAELHLPPPIGFEVLNADCDANPSVYVVMITGCASIDSPVRAAWRGSPISRRFCRQEPERPVLASDLLAGCPSSVVG